MLRFILTILFGAIFAFAGAQPMQQFLFTHLGSRDGLASDETMGVQQDTNGYMWIATLDGLQRYDGKRLMTFRNIPSDPGSIPNDMVRQVQLDKKNRLWLYFSENKAGWLNVSDFTFHPVEIRFPKGQEDMPDGRLFLDNYGNILLLLPGSGVFTYHENANEFTSRHNPFKIPEGWNADWVTQDPFNNNYWIACDSGLVKYNPVMKTLSYRGHNTDGDEVITAYAHLQWVSTPYFDKSGRCWLLSRPKKEQSYFYSYDITLGKITRWETQISSKLGNKYYYLLAIKELKDGTLWIIGGNLFARLNKTRTTFDVIQNNLPGEFSIRYDVLKHLYEDRERNVWLSTNNGLFRFNPSVQLFHVIGNKRINNGSMNVSDVTGVLQTKNGGLLVSTWGEGIFAYDKNFNPVHNAPVNQSLKLDEKLTWCILQRRNGDIWTGNQYGTITITCAFSGKVLKFQPADFEGKAIRHMVEDENGCIWLSTSEGLLVKWNCFDNTFSAVKKLNTTIERLYADKSGYIWVCTRGSGLYKLECIDGSVCDQYTSAGPAGKNLMKPYAMDILAYNDSLYIIASGGLNVLNTRTNTISHLADGNIFPTNNISNIIKDRMGKIWATTLSGLCSVDIENLVTITYDQRDGVPTNFFNSGSATMLQDGSIAIGSSHDLLVFDPAEIKNTIDLSLPDIHLTGFILMNKALLMDSLKKLRNIELPYDLNSFVIQFSSLTYQNNFTISYMLEGLDQSWRNDNGTNQAIFTYLPPGNYTFKVKIENGDEAGSIKYTTLKIKIKSPFWKTWWLLGLLAFAAIGVIYWLDKNRVTRIREAERVRTRIATSLTKDMSNTLNNINVMSELAKIKLDKDAERTREYIAQISDNSSRMIEVMDDMIWSIDPGNDELQCTIVRMKRYAAEIQSKYGLEISFMVDKKVNELKLQMDRRHELFLIFKEALLNAGKHANSKFADVDMRFERSKLKMIISDNGTGFNTETTSYGRGILEMHKKADALNATLVIRSLQDTGTEVMLAMEL